MARAALADMQVRPQYLSVVYHKIPGEAQWTVLSQCRTMSPEQTANKTEAARNRQQEQDDRVRGAQHRGFAAPVHGSRHERGGAASWAWRSRAPAGRAMNRFSLTRPVSQILKIENFNGADTSATLLSTEYINRFKPGKFSHGLDGDEEGGRFVDCSGSADAYYIEPEAG